MCPEPAEDSQPSRGSRLIVRNLPFDFTEQDLRAIFLPHGPIYSTNMPVADTAEAKSEEPEKADQPSTFRSKGFAFVWMLSKKDAEAALTQCNGMKVRAGMANAIVSDKQKRKKDRREEKKLTHSVEEDAEEGVPEQSGSTPRERMMVVDWALSKDRWEEAKAKFEEVGEGEGPEEDVDMKSSGSESEGSGDESEDNSDDEHSEDEHLGVHEEGASDDDDDDDDDDDETYDDTQEAVKPKLPETDVGTTLFIRNIPFTATEDEIRTLYALHLSLGGFAAHTLHRFRAWGPLRYARITIDPETERSRGTGFVCFWNKDDADKVIEQSEMLRTETMGDHPQVQSL